MKNCEEPFSNNSKKSNDLNVNTLNNDFQEEEDEEIEDQKRRNEELRDLLEVAFTDITNEISDDESDNQISTDNISVDINNLNPIQVYPGATSSETVNYLFNRQELDDIYKKYQSNEPSVSENTSYSSVSSSPSYLSQSRRRHISSQRISQLSPLKEIDVSHNITDDSISQTLQQPSESSSSNVISEKIPCACTDKKVEDSRVQELRVLTERVHDLQNELECIKENHNKVVNLKNYKLEQVNAELETVRKLLAETQIKLQKSEDETKALKCQQEATAKRNEGLQCELKDTQTKLVDLENQVICLKQQLKTSTHKTEEITSLEQKYQEQIAALKKTIDEKDEIKSDLESRLCHVTLSYNKVLAERNEICNRYNENCSKLKNAKEENKEITDQLQQKLSENENLKKTNQELLQKLSKLTPELNKILNFTLIENNTPCITSEGEDIDLDNLKTKIDELLNMKTVIDQQKQLIRKLENSYCKEMSTCLTQTEECHEDIKKRDEQIRQYKDIIKVLKKKLDDLVQMDRERQANYHKLQDDYNKLSIDYFKRGDKIEELQCRVKNLDTIIEKLKCEQNQTDQQLNEKFQSELHTIVQKYEQLKKTFTDVSQKLLLTDKENAALKATLHQNNDQITFLKNRIEMYEENSTTFQDLLQSLKMRLKEAEDRLKEMCKIEQENTLLKETIKDLKCNYALACKELETMCKSLQLTNEKEDLIDKVSELTRQEQELEVKINNKMEELYRICQKIHYAQNECCTTLRNTGNDNISACLSRIGDLETEIKKLSEERNCLKQIVIQLREKDKERTHEIEQLKHCLKKSQEETKQMEAQVNDLLQRIQHQDNISQQLKHLEHMVTERLKQPTSTQHDADIQVSINSDEQLLAIENTYKREIQSLQKSFKEIMCRELQALQADYGAKISKLETEKKYLEQCVQSMDQCANETIKGINTEKEAIKTMLNKVVNQLSTFDRREADWKQKQETLEKEKLVLQRGVDKFARTMLEFYFKYQKMRGDIKRIKDEKSTYYEYAQSLKKKMSHLKSDPQPALPCLRRALSESSIAVSDGVDEMCIVPEIQTKSNTAKKRTEQAKQKSVRPTNLVAKSKVTSRDIKNRDSDLNRQKQIRKSKLVQR